MYTPHCESGPLSAKPLGDIVNGTISAKMLSRIAPDIVVILRGILSWDPCRSVVRMFDVCVECKLYTGIIIPTTVGAPQIERHFKCKYRDDTKRCICCYVAKSDLYGTVL